MFAIKKFHIVCYNICAFLRIHIITESDTEPDSSIPLQFLVSEKLFRFRAGLESVGVNEQVPTTIWTYVTDVNSFET